MISVHFSDKPVNNFADAAAANNERFNRYFHHMLNAGVYLPPSAYETWFISNALEQADLDHTIRATEDFLVTEA